MGRIVRAVTAAAPAAGTAVEVVGRGEDEQSVLEVEIGLAALVRFHVRVSVSRFFRLRHGGGSGFPAPPPGWAAGGAGVLQGVLQKERRAGEHAAARRLYAHH
jgi:hypothetical protein